MTRLSPTPLIHATAHVEDSELGRYTEISERCRISETKLDDYSYIMQDGAVWCATIGKFANIAASVRINATNHPTWRPTLHHFTYRAGDYWDDAGPEESFFRMAPDQSGAYRPRCLDRPWRDGSAGRYRWRWRRDRGRGGGLTRC